MRCRNVATGAAAGATVRILWVSPFLPHPKARHAGGRGEYQWMAALAERHDITLVARMEPEERDAAIALRPMLAGLRALTFARPDGPLAAATIVGSYVRLGRMAQRVQDSGDFDVVHVEWLETGLGMRRTSDVGRVNVAIDELTKPARRRAGLAEGAPARLRGELGLRAITLLQHRICAKFDVVLALSEQDRDEIRALEPDTDVRFLPFPVGVDPAKLGTGDRDPDHLLFVGAMNRDTNIDAITWFCAEVLPRVRAQRPGVRLTIAGAAPAEEVVALGADAGIEVTGFVEDLEPYLARATVFVSPLRVGGGIIAKNIDAMASGLPVVTSTIANEGVDATAGDHVLLADGPEAFARAVLDLLGDPALRARLAAGAQAFIEGRFGVRAGAAVLEEAHAAAIAAHTSG
jgi:polysaccharide biosynthesis protein PslH